MRQDKAAELGMFTPQMEQFFDLVPTIYEKARNFVTVAFGNGPIIALAIALEGFINVTPIV